MKDLSIEEKAKAYDEALKVAKGLYAKDAPDSLHLERMFPVLKESENDKVRKKLIHLVKKSHEQGGYALHKWESDEMLAWLEKQGEQKPIDKVEPKFRVGDTIIAKLETCMEHEPFHITNISDGFYWSGENSILVDNQNEFELYKVEPKFREGDWVVCEVTGSVYQINYCIENSSNHKYGYDLINGGYIGNDDVNHYHLWTIKDAKPGDVLCTYECEEPKIVFVLKGTPKKHYALSYYYFYNIMYPHFDDGNKPGCLAPEDSDVRPATKEQCDLLFAKMKEAGYEWDAEKKELKKIEQRMVSAEAKEALLEEKPTEPLVLTDKQTAIDTLMQTVKVLKERGLYSGLQESLTALAVDLGKSNVVKPAEWSEEDEDILKTCLYFFNGGKGGISDNRRDNILNWFKSLKDRIQLKPVEAE